jgi:hypothetical protein
MSLHVLIREIPVQSVLTLLRITLSDIGMSSVAACQIITRQPPNHELPKAPKLPIL